MIRFKQNGFKRALALLLSVFMAMSALSVTAFADTAATDYGTTYYGDWTIVNVAADEEAGTTASGTATLEIEDNTYLTYISPSSTIISYGTSGSYYCVRSNNSNGAASNGIVTTTDSTRGYAYYKPTTDGTLSLYVRVADSQRTLVVSKTSDSGDSEAICSFIGDGSSLPEEGTDYSASYSNPIITVDIEAEAGYTYYVAMTNSKLGLYGAVFTPYATVSGTVSGADESVDVNSLDYGLTFTNDDTSVSYEATVSGTSYSITLKPNCTYTAALTGTAASDHALTGTKQITVSSTAENTLNLTVQKYNFYTITGTVSNIDSSYSNFSNVKVVFTPGDSNLDTVSASLDASSGYSASLVAGVDYTVSVTGANDYKLSDPGTVNNSSNAELNLTLSEVTKYTVTGDFLGLDFYGDGYDTLSVTPTAITFTNVDDGYVYSGTPSAGSYSVSLRNGAYLASITLSGYSTSTHVTVNGQDTTRDLLLKSSSTTSIAYTDTLYVGSSQEYKTVQAAVDAATNMSSRNSQRVTIKIDPGTYREQVVINTPNITLESNGGSAEDTKITWYYGVGYCYYSCVDSYYDPYAAYDKYEKGDVISYWGSAVITNSKAEGFRAEGITFENSFNKYMTTEEVTDGVEVNGRESITLDRTTVTDDSVVQQKTNTERAAALVNYADNIEFKDCSFIGSQDTLMTGNRGTHSSYYKDCYIEGQTDFIFGNGDVIFDGCELNLCGYTDAAAAAYITANSSSSSYTAAYGYIFNNCYISKNSERYTTASYFGRPWYELATVTFLNTELEDSSMIAGAGWYSMGSNDPADTTNSLTLVEYNTYYDDEGTITAVDTSSRAAKAYSQLLTADTYDPWDYSVEEVLISTGGWTPSYYTPNTAYLDFTTSDALALYDTNASSTFKGDDYGVYAGIYTNDDSEEFKTTVYDSISYYSSTASYGVKLAYNKSVPVFAFKAEDTGTYTISWTEYKSDSTATMGLYSSYDSTNGLADAIDVETMSTSTDKTLTYTKETTGTETIYVGSEYATDTYVKSFSISTSLDLVTGTVEGLESDDTDVTLTLTNIADEDDVVTATLSDLTGSGVSGLTAGTTYSVTAVGNGVYTSTADATVTDDNTIEITLARIEFDFPLNLSGDGDTYKSYFSIQGLLDSNGYLTADTTDYYSGITVYTQGMIFTDYLSSYGVKSHVEDILSFTAESTGTVSVTVNVTTSGTIQLKVNGTAVGDATSASGETTVTADVSKGDIITLSAPSHGNFYYSSVAVSYEEETDITDRAIVTIDGTRYIVFGVSDDDLSKSSFNITKDSVGNAENSSGGTASFDTVYKAVQFSDGTTKSASELVDGYSYVVAFKLSDDSNVTDDTILEGFSLSFNS